MNPETRYYMESRKTISEMEEIIAEIAAEIARLENCIEAASTEPGTGDWYFDTEREAFESEWRTWRCKLGNAEGWLRHLQEKAA